MDWNTENMLSNIRQAATDDLLDRITAYRLGMEPDAIALIEKELLARGVSDAQIAEHRDLCERDCVFLADGTAAVCSFCRRPAVAAGRGWWKVWWTVPIFPRWLRYCDVHRPKH